MRRQAFYRALLRLYPSSFRVEYGDELTDAFLARTSGSSPIGALASAVADVIPNAAAAHGDILRADLHLAARALRRSPGFAITTTLVVALGVGANTAAFSLADFVLLRPPPFPEPDRLVSLWEQTPGYRMELSPGNYRDWKAESKSFAAMSSYFTMDMNLTGSGEPRRVSIARVNADFFATLGIKPLVGRGFVAADTVADEAITISYDLWQTQYGGDPGIIGRRLSMNDQPVTVIGVMPPEFHFPSSDVVIWRTVGYTSELLRPRADNFIYAVARLRPGVTLQAAERELKGIAARLEREFPTENKATSASVESMNRQLGGRPRLLLLALCGASLCILLLACANLANLLLARAVSRERELAVRAALGAGRDRLVRQIVTEALVLAALGGIAGVLLAVAAVPVLARILPADLPLAAPPSVDLRVLAFAAAVVVLTGLFFSILPAFHASRADAFRALREDSRSGEGSRRRVRSVLVVVEIAASVVLLISSGLLVRAMWRLQAIDPGFRADHVLTLETALSSARYETVRGRQPFYDKVLGEIRAMPGVEGAAYTSYTPMTMHGGIWPVLMPGATDETRSASNSASLRFATPQFFSTLRIPLRQGREIEETDTNEQPSVAIVSESFVKRYWPKETPIGKRFRFAFRERTIVGVVGDVRVRGLEQPSEPQVYIPYKQVDSANLAGYTPKDLVIRSTLPPATLVSAVRRIVHEADPLQPISNIRTMDEIVANETASRAAQLRVIMILAGIALLLSAVGLHGLLSFTVAARSREIGVRMALGAQASEVRGMVLREGLLLAVLGVIPGALVAYAAGRGMQALLVGIEPGDLPTFAAATALCAAAAILGCLRPALRASRVDPMTAIRAE